MASQQESPYTVHAESKLLKFKTRQTKKPAPWPRDSLLVRIGCSVRISSESHHLTPTGPGRSAELERQQYEYAPDSDEEVVIVVFHAEDLRSDAACRAAFRRKLRRLPQLAGFRGAEVALWDAFVPPGVVGEILSAAASALVAAGGEEEDDLRSSVGYCCDVWMHVEAATVYSEAKALLLSCTDDDVVGGGEEQCPICMEELTEDGGGVTALPGCSHAFHRACILEWLHTAPTCPCCRGELMQYLPHQYCQCDEA
ncbi:uncharacterized protein LOC104583370 [Brachypodium distachyon]|uniref:RING-type E3 ubiquitin transferase n=1 Tax=Brachypodium distachyon TaxID=15368 RepID=I1HUV4_BRADI|nr:uncharacterized protein LOC104583370 [Brachypodium distachyon]KQK11360.1 hypothetical protein BRADI_2g59680v3 [Brachypodium distachyon]|eukprot:XP_010233591.1 uncharacterized protein LOC104583370 [Brachypodium distachyon]